MTSNLEDLIAENRTSHHPELMAARSVPRDEQATADLKGDADRMARLAELAEVEPEAIADCAVRGANVTFQVLDADGAPSAGFFPLASLDSGKRRRSSKKGGVAQRTGQDHAPRGGTASVPSVVSTGADETDAEVEPEADQEPTPDGVPDDFDSLSGDTVASLLKDTPDGVDAMAVLRHEFATRETPRVAVVRAASKVDLLDENGQPKTDAQRAEDLDPQG